MFYARSSKLEARLGPGDEGVHLLLEYLPHLGMGLGEMRKMVGGRHESGVNASSTADE